MYECMNARMSEIDEAEGEEDESIESSAKPLCLLVYFIVSISAFACSILHQLDLANVGDKTNKAYRQTNMRGFGHVQTMFTMPLRS